MQTPSVFGISVDFILFGLTLAGVAVFHKCTMPVALTGLGTIVVYKIAFTGFKTGQGVLGFISHVGGGSMIWFGSSAGVAISSIFPEAKSAFAWIKGGWFVVLAYLVGFAAMLAVIGWHPDPTERSKHGRPEQMAEPLTSVESRKARWQIL